VQFSVGGATTESDLFLDHLPLPMGRTVLTAQLQANVRTLVTGSVELSRIVAVDALAHELAGAYFIGTPQGVLVEICDKSACPYTHNMGVTTSSGWHTFAFDVTLGPSAASLSWQAYGLSGKSVSVAVNYGAPVAGIRTVIGAKSTDTSALTYWDNVTIDWY
jgi:hypothetical protein